MLPGCLHQQKSACSVMLGSAKLRRGSRCIACECTHTLQSLLETHAYRWHLAQTAKSASTDASCGQHMPSGCAPWALQHQWQPQSYQVRKCFCRQGNKKAAGRFQSVVSVGVACRWWMRRQPGQMGSGVPVATDEVESCVSIATSILPSVTAPPPALPSTHTTQAPTLRPHCQLSMAAQAAAAQPLTLCTLRWGAC